MSNAEKQNNLRSPWISELKYERQSNPLAEDKHADVVIVGGGISGFATAFFILKYTKKTVILIEAGQIGHGATGHNAGQVVDYFEKFFSDIVADYGPKMAAEAQNAVSSGWKLLDIILADSKIDIEFSKFIGYAGCTSIEQLLLHLENKYLKVKNGVKIRQPIVAKEFLETNPLPKKYDGLYKITTQELVLEALETNNKKYIAALQSQKGCLNSALFVEKLEEYLTSNYSSRFELYEYTKATRIFLGRNNTIIQTSSSLIGCEKVVLCTNGFENLDIVDQKERKKINSEFHNMVYSIVGYMAGYVEEREKDPIAISYFTHRGNPSPDDPYIYLTRRNYTHKGKDKSLICIGGPEKIKEQDIYKYIPDRKYPNFAKEAVHHFLDKHYKHKPTKLKDFDFKWHGLMGYTQSGIRAIGPEPMNPNLLYNLGCNGVGILPSIYGGKKIADHIAGKQLQKTIFDPDVQRKVLKKLKTK